MAYLANVGYFKQPFPVERFLCFYYTWQIHQFGRIIRSTVIEYRSARIYSSNISLVRLIKGRKLSTDL